MVLPNMVEEMKLGKRYRDTVTGFEGIATGKITEANGVVTWGLEAKHDPVANKTPYLAFDDFRLEYAPSDDQPDIPQTEAHPTQDVHLGQTYRDTVSGFEGVATGVIEFINGCVHVELTAPYDKTSDSVPRHRFDEERLVNVKTGEAAPVHAQKGGDMRMPDCRY